MIYRDLENNIEIEGTPEEIIQILRMDEDFVASNISPELEGFVPDKWWDNIQGCWIQNYPFSRSAYNGGGYCSYE